MGAEVRPAPSAVSSLPDRPDRSEEIVPFTAGDGHQLNLIHVRGPVAPAKGPVIVVHGAGVRANIFRAPTGRTLVDVLVESGYDVWLENWRASIDLTRMEWTLDQAALYDHPHAVQTICQRTGADSVQAIVHCQGSTSFMMSAVAGLLPQVTTIVSNAVSLHPVIPRFARFKLEHVIPVAGHWTRYANPHWGRTATTAFAKLTDLAVQATHHECHNPVCKMVSFVYGSGRPALWRHENLNDATHRWLTEEFGASPLTFFTQMARCVQAGNLLSVEGHPELPADFTAQPPQTEARVALFGGALNRCFLPASQLRTFDFLDRHQPGHHSVDIIPGYGHLDVFMGANAARDIFPAMMAALDRRHAR
jgi:hypothetical protein